MFKKVILGLSLPVLLFSEGLNDLVEMSLENKNITAYKIRTEAIKEEYKSTKRSYLPNVSVGGAYSDVAHETAANADNSFNAYVDISYRLYDGGRKELTYKSYESQIKTSLEDLTSLKNRVTLDVVNHYFNYLTYTSQKKAKYKEIEQLNAQYERLSKFVDAGTTTIDELDRIVSNLERANLELQQLELAIQTALHELEYITGKKVFIKEGSYIQLSEDKAEPRNDIKALKHSMQTQLLEAKSVKTQNNPQVNINNTYTYYENNFDNATYDTNALDDQNVLAVNVSWNVFDFDTNELAYRAAYKSFLSSKSTYEYEKRKAEVDLNLAKRSYEIAKLNIKSANASLHAAISAYDVIKNRYENGLVDNVAYLEALSDRSDAQSSLAAAKFGLEISKANVIYQKGKNVWEYIK